MENNANRTRSPAPIGTYAVELNTPKGIHPVFHVDLIYPAGDDPFPPQRSNDQQPGPVLVEGEEEWEIEEIMGKREKRRGRGRTKEYLVKWVGYAKPDWTNARGKPQIVSINEVAYIQEGTDGERKEESSYRNWKRG